ncbi:hypothetical protein NEUTE2DRAFT_130609 [Neurospora tetrasperma FGSC 2509]|nr:hypothetical protein NEUTE2DRAFT_130609 [Neurospora tetrasperma FGSC 2509]
MGACPPTYESSLLCVDEDETTKSLFEDVFQTTLPSRWNLPYPRMVYKHKPLLSRYCDVGFSYDRWYIHLYLEGQNDTGKKQDGQPIAIPASSRGLHPTTIHGIGHLVRIHYIDVHTSPEQVKCKSTEPVMIMKSLRRSLTIVHFVGYTSCSGR